MSSEIGIEDRRSRELQLLSGKNFMSVLEIAQTLEVSSSTIRRDMELLEQQGVVRRTHGGAIYLGDSIQSPNDIGQGHLIEKQAIARAVADLIPAGETVMLNGGSTCFQVARALQGRRLNVVTNSAAIASLLCSDAGTEVTLLGGYLYPRIGVSVGAMAERQAELLHATRFITSCAGVKDGAVFEPNQMMADIERRMMKSSDQVILAVDHWKLGSRAVVKLCELADIDVIVTDAAAVAEQRAWLGSLNTKVVFAEL